MANILKFPETSGGVKRLAFLQDGDDILHFDDQTLANDHTFPLPKAKSYRDLGKLRAKDWSNQELANLFRVKRLLDAAGVPNEIDRGITDEGDPWFLFCDGNGEVYIHLCRLDGVYLLDSPNISQPLRGRDFNALIEEFTRRRAPAEGDAPDTQRVVRLGRNGKVFLHPSTILAALIWTLFLAAEELVLILPEESAGSPVPDLPGDLVPGSGPWDTEFDPLQLTLQDQGMQDDAVRQDGVLIRDAHDTEAFTEEKLGQNTYAIGLSAIAISLGFMSETQVPDVDAMTPESILAMIAGQESAAGDGMDDLGFAQTGMQDFLAALTRFFDEVSLAGRDGKEATTSDIEVHQDANVQGHVSAFVEGLATQVSAFLEAQEQLRDTGKPTVETARATATPEVEAVQDALAETAITYAQDTDQMAQMLSRFGLENVSENLETNAREYTFDNNAVVATFDVSASELEKARDLITGPPETGKPAQDVIDVDFGGASGQKNQFQLYDDEAFAFISFLMSKDNDLEMIVVGNELILLDPEIFNVAVEDTFTASWTLDNGEIISTIGLRSDYEAYDLVV